MRSRALQRVLRLLLCGPLGGDQLNDNGTPLLVELDVFSGRPNPRWELDEPQTRQVRELEGRLTTSRDAGPEPPGLGYRGFVYAGTSGLVRAYRGYVRSGQSVLADPTFSIERFLLDHLPAELEEWRDTIAAELHRSQQY